MRAGIVGVGFMSWIHYLAYQRSEHADLVAFCSRDEKKRSGDWRDIKGNFGPPGEQIDVSSLNVFVTQPVFVVTAKCMKRQVTYGIGSLSRLGVYLQ